MVIDYEEAKRKWCPFARYSDKMKITAANRIGSIITYSDNPEQCRCISEECMMWEWKTEDDGEYEGYCGLSARR